MVRRTSLAMMAMLALAASACGTGRPQAAPVSQNGFAAAQRVEDAARFRASDRDGDGRLSPAEAGLNAAAFAALDADADGGLSPAEAARPAEAAGARLYAEIAGARLEDGGLGASALQEPLGPVSRLVPGANPVILIPGYLDLEIYFVRIKSRLRARGLEYEYLDLFPNIRSIKDGAAKLAAKVQAVKARTGARKVDLVGHSMGGLISRYYLKELGGLAHVERLVTIASPHHGTIMAHLGPGGGAGEMLIGSEFLRALNQGDETPGAVKYHSLRGGLDEIVIPHDSPILEGAENHFIRWAAHGSILINGTAMRRMEDALAR